SDWHLIEDFDIGSVGPGSNQVKIADGTQSHVADVGDTQLVHRFGDYSDFTKHRGPKQHDLRLHDIKTSFFEQPTEFVKAAVRFSACDLHIHRAVQFREPVEVIARQGLFQPIYVHPLILAGRFYRPSKIPRYSSGGACIQSRLIAVASNDPVVAHSFSC